MKPNSLCLLLSFAALASAGDSKFGYDTEIETTPLKPLVAKLGESDISRLVNNAARIDSAKRIVVTGIVESAPKQYWQQKTAGEIEFKWVCDSTVGEQLKDIQRSTWTKSLPSILIPEGSGLSHYREAAARMKANILLLYKADANIFENSKLFGPNTVMAISNVEFIALNVESGVVLASRVISNRVKFSQQKEESSAELVARTKGVAILQALREGAAQIKSEL